MGDIVPLHKPKPGQTAFMRCLCQPQGTDFVPVFIFDKQPIVYGLICPACEKSVPVVNGVVEAEVKRNG